MDGYETMARITETIAQTIAENIGLGDWEDYMVVAKAVLREIRIPTATMLDYGGEIAPDDEPMGTGYALSVWQTMIDQALEEKDHG